MTWRTENRSVAVGLHHLTCVCRVIMIGLHQFLDL